jgi:NADP-dependent 3-hydroxy acid dehydrogenase YdfG
VKAFAKSMLEKLKTIDVLINNAGVFIPGDISTEEEGLLETLIETNLYSAYHLTRALLPSMMTNNLGKGSRGHIFNICSIAGLKAYPQGGSYSISKYALIGFSTNLRMELMPYQIKVTTVNPGATMSHSWNGSGVNEERIMKASDVADTIWGVYNLSPQAVVEEIVLRPMLGDL